ncbi:hypothetical protein ACE6H2_015117 [Prunus campanulata]
MASSSKTFLLLGFMFALVILISSEVSARELVQNPYGGNTYPFKGRPSTPIARCRPYIRPCQLNPPPPSLKPPPPAPPLPP